MGEGCPVRKQRKCPRTRVEVERLRISPYIRLIHFRVPHFGSQRSDSIRELHFLMFVGFFAFSNLRKVRGFRSSLGGPNSGRYCCVQKKSMFAFLSVWKTRRRDANSGPLLADRILQQIGSERSDSIREMHFWGCFLFFCVFKPEEGTWISKHFSTPAEPS